MVSLLKTHLATHAPLIWVVSDEPRRVAESVCDFAGNNREVFRHDLMDGLQQWHSDAASWKIVTVPVPRDPETGEERPPEPIHGEGESLQYITKSSGVYIMEHAHLQADQMIHFLGYLSRKWLDAFYGDGTNMGPTIVMISYSATVPPELARGTTKVHFDLPDAAELEGIVSLIVEQAELAPPDANQKTLLVRAGLGLSEFEYINAAALSLSECGHLAPERISAAKFKALAAGGVLEVRQPALTMADIGGLDQAKTIIEYATWIWQHPKQAAELELVPLHRILLVGVPGCMTGDSLVLTDKGILRYDKLVTSSPETASVIGIGGKPTTVSALYDKGLQPTVRVIAAGHNAIVTPWHRFLTLTTHGECEWKRADKLVPTDRIALYRGTELWGTSTDLSQYAPNENTPGSYQKNLQIPTGMTPELAELLGAIVADADIDDDQVRIHNQRAGIFERLPKLIEKVFGFTPKQNQTGHSYSTDINSRRISWWLTEIGMQRGSLNKQVPPCITMAPRDIVVAFLRGIFHDSTASTGGWVFSSASKDVADFVAIALLNMGICCTRSIGTNDGRAKEREPNPCYKIAVRGADEIRKLLQTVPLNKQDLHEPLALLAERQGNPNLDSLFIPDLLQEMVAVSTSETRRNLAAASAYSYFGANSQSVGYKKLAELVALASSSPARNRAAELLELGHFWAPVYTVEATETQQVYDMTVPEGEAYVANGMLNHNSGKSALCEATASGLGLELVKFGASRFMNKFIGQSEENTRKAFAQVAVMAPIVLWDDELARNLSGGESSAVTDGGTTDRVHGEWLQGLQDLPKNVFMMCAANRVDGLPPEMLRADRMDKVLFIGFPTIGEREDIFRIHLGQHPEDFDLPALAQASPYFTGAEIKAAIAEVRFMVGAGEHRRPVTEDILAFLPTMKHRVWITHQDQIRALYIRAKNEWTWASSAQEAEAPTLMGTGNVRTHTPATAPDTNMFKSGWSK